MKRIFGFILILALLLSNCSFLTTDVRAGEMGNSAEYDVADSKIEEEENGTEDTTEPDNQQSVSIDSENIEEGKGATYADSNEEMEEEQLEEELNMPEEDDPEKGDRANSWRYQDGEQIPSVQSRARTARVYHANATRTGIDVSEHNGVINWEQVKASGIDFAIIRCGYGMDQTDQDDKQWIRNVTECERLGIPYGVYIYSYATNTDRARSEAQHVLRLIQGRNLSYPVYFDMEDDSTLGADLAAIAETFCSTIENAGYAVGIYANTNWWNSYLTDARFSQWYRWVAEWGASCNYKGTYAMWQYSNTGSVPGISGNVDMNYLIGYPDDHGTPVGVEVPSEVANMIKYSAHISDIGWMNDVNNGQISGSSGSGKQLEALKISINDNSNLGVEYQAHLQNIGWQDYVANGDQAGTTGENQPIEALRIRLTGNEAQNYNIFYRVYVESIGWLDWAKNGETAGTVGYAYHIEAYQIALLSAASNDPGSTAVPFLYKEAGLGISARAHVSSIGWQDAVVNGDVIGTTGQNLGIEAFSITSSTTGVGVEYSSYTDSTDWQAAVKDGATSGTTGQNKQFQAIKIELTGTNAGNYHVYYRTHVSELGWLDWTQDGEEAGNKGYGYKIEAIQILILPNNSEYAPAIGENACEIKPQAISYSAHVEDIGWQNYVEDGATAGTTGENKQIEAIKIRITGQEYTGGVEYAAHVSDIGWQDPVQTDEIAGTTGKNKSIEAVSINLTGEMATNYDIYYRVHSSDFGWLGWAKNGENAGTEGYAKQVEALEIRLVPKNGEAPGSTDNAFQKKPTTIIYTAHVQDIGWQGSVQNGATAGTTGKNKQLEAIKIQLNRQEYTGGVEYAAHVSDIGWQDYVQTGGIAGTTGKNKSIEAVSINLTGEMATNYDIYYRVHSSNFGWLGWAKNGENAGTEGYAKHAEAIEIKLVKKGGEAPGNTENAFYKK